MSVEASAIRNANRGARFYRADLHIHSYGPNGMGSSDVDDSSMTPEAIVETAVGKGLGVISVTDHNVLENVSRAIEAANGKELLVVPGIELTTLGGHLLVYAESVDALRRIVGGLTFNANRSACRTSVFDILSVVRDHGGLAIAAHVDLEDGLETGIPGYGDPKISVFCSEILVALEVARASAVDLYTERDAEPARRNILKKRLDTIGDVFLSGFPKIQSSDAHKLSALGRNYDKKDRLTRLKMHGLDWQSFRRAFSDPEARVRIEEEIPQATPGFVGMHMTGGFLDGQTVAFSKNLTCIIGGRGSGKSTAFQSLRAAAGRSVPADLQDSEAWPHQIDLLYRDEFGAELHIQVGSDGAISNISEPSATVPEITIESLSQGDMARTIERCGEDPAALLTFLDELADLREPKQRAEATRRQLIQNGDQIATLEAEVAKLENVQKTLTFKEAQEKTARQEKGHELVDQQAKLTRAMRIRDQLLPTFKTNFDDLSAAVDVSLLDSLLELSRLAEGLSDVPIANPLPATIGRLTQVIADAKAAISAERKTTEIEVQQFVVACQKVQHKLNEDVQKRVAALREKGVPLDVRALATLTAELQKLREQEGVLKRQQKDLASLRATRVKLLARYRESRADIFSLRSGIATRLTAQLRETLVDMTLRLQFREARLSSAAERALKDVMDWRTAAVPKAAALVRALGVVELMNAIVAGNADVLLAAETEDGEGILTKADATGLIERMGMFANRRRLEEAVYDDAPRLIVSRVKVDADGNALKDVQGRVKFATRHFDQLSLGQQQAIVLGMLLCSDSTAPLLIDQPEDNLDSAFVFKILVRALRRIKEKRQVILVTHNANIGVLSDTDLVVPLKATAEAGWVMSPGSVETTATRDLVCEVLEGGRAAYERRGHLYGQQKSGA